jgi:tripartite-type tricarboxylate transporter receptor subunit TctC
MKRIRRFAVLLALAALPAFAQQFPTKPVTVVVPTAPGGPLDTLIRLTEPRVTPLLGQPLVIENRPGAGTYLGGEHVARAAPDGYTLLFNATSGLFPDVFMKGLSAKLAEELTPVALIGRAYYIFYGPSSVPAKDMRELINLVKAEPGKYNLAIFPGAVSTLQCLVFLEQQQKVKMLQVPFNSTANIITAMLRGDVHLYVGSGGAIRSQVDAGKIRVFATVGDKRAPGFESVPTTTELGLGKVDISGEYAIMAPVKTPAAVIRVLNDKFRQVVATPEMRALLEKNGFDAEAQTPEAMRKDYEQLKADVPRMAKAAGVAPQ